MARFTFRLEILLKLALNKEEDAKKELASWQKLKSEADEKLRITICNITNTTIEKGKQKDISEIILYEKYIDSLIKKQKITEEEIEYFIKEISKAISKLQEAMKERKILEKLKEKKLENFTFEQNQIEQKENDEIGTKIFIDSR